MGKKILKNGDYSQAESIGARIRECRERKGLSIEDVAGLIGYSYDHFCKVERGERTFPVELLGPIAKKLDTTPDYLIFGEIHCSQEAAHAIQIIILLLQDLVNGYRKAPGNIKCDDEL